MRAFEHRDVSRESDGERRKQDVHCDHPRELHSRQEESIHGVHPAVESRDGNVKCDSSNYMNTGTTPCMHVVTESLDQPLSLDAGGSSRAAYAGYFIGHASQCRALLPMLNGGELAVTWCFVFFARGLSDHGQQPHREDAAERLVDDTPRFEKSSKRAHCSCAPVPFCLGRSAAHLVRCVARCCAQVNERTRTGVP